MNLELLDDRELIHETERIAQNERACTIALLHHLNEIGRRKLHLDMGYSSLYDYCIKKLGYSSSAAGRRIAAARCIRRIPETLALLEAGELNLCTLAMIEPVLNEENAASILPRVQGASRRDVEKLMCEFRPPLHLHDRIRPVRVAMGEPIDIDTLLFRRFVARAVPEEYRQPTRITDKLYVQFLADEELVAQLEEATALLCGRHSDMTIADVLGIVLGEFVDRRSPKARKARREAREKDKEVRTPTGGSEMNVNPEEPVHTAAGGNGISAKPDRPAHTPTGGSASRHIPAAVRDEVHVRDGGQCTFTSGEGTRCEATKGLEIDHIVPVAVGGTNDASNLRLLCPAHNLRAAEHTLGTDLMAPFWKRE